MRGRLVCQARTRFLWLLMRSASLERRRTWAAKGWLRPLGPVLSTGTVSILGGPAVRLRLHTRCVSPAGAQAYSVLTGTHEVQVEQAMMRSVAHGDVVWDVGANVGYMSLVAARLVGPSGKVLAIEPETSCAAAIRDHAAINGLENIQVVEGAAGDRNAQGQLVVVADSLWSRLSTVGDHDEATHRILVRLLRLDDLEQPAPTVVKIDVEGAELDVIGGMQRLLRDVRPIVICEMHGRNAEFCDAMREVGYVIRNLDGPEPVRHASGNVHAICEPSEGLRYPG